MSKHPEKNAGHCLTPEEFIRQMSHVEIAPDDLKLIYEIGLDMEMDPRDICDFVRTSDIKEQLISREMSQKCMETRLFTVLPFDDVAERARETNESFKRFVIIMAFRKYERLQYLKARGLYFEGLR